jgi:hypothetical protein
LDASLLDDDGIALHLAAREDGQRIVEQVLEETRNGKGYRQSFLDMGNQLLGTPKVELKKTIPAMIEPSGLNKEALDVFFGQVAARIREGRVLILGDLSNLIQLEMMLTPDVNLVTPGLQVVAWVLPGHYALLAPKHETLRRAVRASEDEFRKAIVLDVGAEGDRVRALDWPDDTSENEDRLLEAMDHLHSHLDISSQEMWDVFAGHHGSGLDYGENE